MASATIEQVRRQRTPIVAVLSANVISITGSMLTTVAVPWFVLVTTGSAAKTGITAAVSVLPIILAGIFGGTLVNRLGFKRTSILADLSSGAAIALIPLLYHTAGLAFWTLLVLLFAGRLLSSPGRTARQSLMPGLAGLAEMPLERANSVYSAAYSMSSLLGPVLAGVLIAALGASNVLFIDAATFLVSAVLIGAVVPADREPVRKSDGRNTYFADLNRVSTICSKRV